MKKNLCRICLFSGLTALLFLAACGFAACNGGQGTASGTDGTADPGTDPEPAPDTEAPAVPTEAPSDAQTDPADPETQPETETAAETAEEVVTYPAWTGEANAKTVNTAAALANRVTAYYEGEGRGSFTVKNENVLLTYDMTDRGTARIASVATPDGKPYLVDSGDSYVRLSDGSVFYASGTSARANVYDQGFYYYDVHILDQSFSGPDTFDTVSSIDPKKTSGLHDMSKTRSVIDGVVAYKVTDPTDPNLFWTKLNVDAAQTDAIVLTVATSVSTEGYLYFSAGPHAEFNNDQKIRFVLQNDGDLHTVVIPMKSAVDFTGKLTGIRFDIGTVKDEAVSIGSIRCVSFRDDVPNVSLDRNFIAYSDKLNDVTRFIATSDCAGIDALGTEYRIPADTVSKIVVTDKNGTHDSLSGVDAGSIEAVGFDVKDAGVFGIILLDDGSGAKLIVCLSDGVYTVRQEWACDAGSLKNNQEITAGRRLYTDGTHDFDAFLYEAYCERNPLTGVRVVNEAKGKTYYAGYNALRGVYEFMVESGYDFSALYNDPDHKYPVTFELDGDEKDRRIYVMSHTTRGWLECAALLDESQRMLPVRLEVNKNFAGDGEEPFYTHNDSVAYGFTVFPMVAEAGNTERLTVVHLYERWGVFRLKQISSIRFHQAYYHQSLGVTETNCIAFYNYGNRLPDHRGLSQPYWEDVYFYSMDGNGNPIGKMTPMNGGPEHENTGTHTFLQYVDADGRTVKTESRAHDIDSSGPTYYDITMHYVTTDGRMTADIRHAEMPQYDENRAYTQLDYEVLEAVSVRSFRDDFELYGITSSKLPQQFTKVGYLDENGKSRIVDANTGSNAVTYVLGREYPYFDYFKLTDTSPTSFDSSDLYSNVSAIIRGWDIVIGGKTYDGPLVLSEKECRLVLTLDLGEVTLLPGDHIRIDLILMPWGGYDSVDDENVRLTRENTLLHPVAVTSDTDVVLTDDPWVPKVRSADGNSAVFTLSGGLDNLGDRIGTASEGNTKFKTYYDRDFNVTVRVYGLHTFGTAGIYEQIDGAWVPVPLASADGYDGYAILYDEDNTFSVSFVVNMNEAQPRTFRVVTE